MAHCSPGYCQNKCLATCLQLAGQPWLLACRLVQDLWGHAQASLLIPSCCSTENHQRIDL